MGVSTLLVQSNYVARSSLLKGTILDVAFVPLSVSVLAVVTNKVETPTCFTRHLFQDPLWSVSHNVKVGVRVITT